MTEALRRRSIIILYRVVRSTASNWIGEAANFAPSLHHCRPLSNAMRVKRIGAAFAFGFDGFGVLGFWVCLDFDEISSSFEVCGGGGGGAFRLWLSVGFCNGVSCWCVMKNVCALRMVVTLIFVEVWLILKLHVEEGDSRICRVVAIF